MKHTTTNQVIWEILNAALYDLQKGTTADGVAAIEEVIRILEQQGAGK